MVIFRSNGVDICPIDSHGVDSSFEHERLPTTVSLHRLFEQETQKLLLTLPALKVCLELERRQINNRLYRKLNRMIGISK